MIRKIFNTLPFIAIVLYYIVGGFIRYQDGRPEAFLYDKKYGDILKAVVSFLPIYLAGVNFSSLRKNVVGTFLKILLIEFLCILCIGLGDDFVLTIGGKGELSLISAIIPAGAFLAFIASFCLIYTVANKKMPEKTRIFYNFLPLIVVATEFFIWGILGLCQNYSENNKWFLFVLIFLLVQTSVIRFLSPVIYPVFLVILNREEIKSKKVLLIITGVLSLYTLLTAVLKYDTSYGAVAPAIISGVIFLL